MKVVRIVVQASLILGGIIGSYQVAIQRPECLSTPMPIQNVIIYLMLVWFCLGWLVRFVNELERRYFSDSALEELIKEEKDPMEVIAMDLLGAFGATGATEQGLRDQISIYLGDRLRKMRNRGEIQMNGTRFVDPLAVPQERS